MKRIAFFLSAILFAAAPAVAEQSVDRKIAAEKDGVVQIYNVAGSVRVKGRDAKEVAVTGTLGDGVERLEFSGGGGKTVIKVILIPQTHERGDAELEISVPAGSGLEIETVSATIDAAGVTGESRLSSTSGWISLQGCAARFDARSTSGDIDISAAGVPGRARTVSGRITLKGVKESVEAFSVSGSLEIEGTGVTDAELETTSGSIRFSGVLGKNARLDARSVSGSVDVHLQADIAAEFDVSTFSGGISSDFGGSAISTGMKSSKTLSFSTGNAARVVIDTFSGSVRLKKR